MKTNNYIQEISKLVKKSLVLAGSELIASKYTQNTLNTNKKIFAVIIIESWDDLREILKYCNQKKISIYPFSTGHNWGYGCHTPVIDNCILIDLSCMNKIISFDAQTGIVEVEPGVTQQELYEYLQLHNHNFIVPTTGAGPDCSLIGNILERGMGLSPINDHCQSLCSLKAILADGSLYCGSFPESCENLEKSYPYSIGPNIAPLMIQSNFSIITSMSIKLKRDYQSNNLAIILLPHKEIDDEVCSLIRGIHNEIGRDHMSNISLMHMQRFSRFCQLEGHKSLVDSFINYKIKRVDWLLFFSIYGNKTLMPAMRRLIQKISPYKVKFTSKSALQRSMQFLKLNRYFGSYWLEQWLYFKETALLAYSGVPTSRGLQLVYDKPIEKLKSSPNPTVDECGFYWCTLIMPLRDVNIRQLHKQLVILLKEHNLDQYISYTTFNEDLILASVILLYDKGDQDSLRNCEQCYHKILDAAISLGAHPQRLSINSMPSSLKMTKKEHWYLVKKIKLALDPNGILSPGRYE